MSKRVTIVIDDDTDRKVRRAQAKIIEDCGKSYSYSEAIRDLLQETLK